MKKLLTLILPALALTTGAPMADAADYHGAIQWGYTDEMKYRYGISVGKTSLDAARQEAEAKCRQAGANFCPRDWLYDITTLPPASAMQNEKFRNWIEHHTQRGEARSSFRCVAFATDRAKTYLDTGGFASWGESKQEAFERAKQRCKANFSNCQLNDVAVCADDGVTQVADAAPQPAEAADPAGRYGAFAIDNETRDIGYSVWYPRQTSADERALSECANYGGRNCAISHRFPHRCAALFRAEQGDSWAWGFGYADSKAEAIDAARSECQGRGVSGCALQSSACGAGADSGPTPEQRRATIDAARQEAAQQATGTFGAFALDGTAWAYAFAGGERTQAEADREALSMCAQQGGKACGIKYQYTESRCGAAAFAEERGLRAWGFGHADSRGEAIDNALGHCKQENTSGAACHLASVTCGE